MRVGLISYDFCCPYIGGMGMHVTELFKRINEVDDMEVIAISGRKNNFSNAFYVSTPNFQFLPEFFFFSFIVNCKINNWIKNYDLDLIHMHGGQGGVQLLRRVKVPLLYTVHHSYAQVYKFFPNRMYRIPMQLEKISYQHAYRIIAVSSTTKESLIKDYGINREKISIIPNGVDTMLFSPKKDVEKIPESILHVGRLEPRKGISTLLKAIALVKKEIPDIHLYLIGKGDIGGYKSTVSELSLQNQVTFLGTVSQRELIEWYNRVEICVIASVVEGFGRVAVESMACKTPVIGTEVPGLVDIIADGETGILVPPEKEDALAKAIINLISDPELRQRMGEQARKRVKERFELNMVLDKVFDQYRSLYLE